LPLRRHPDFEPTYQDAISVTIKKKSEDFARRVNHKSASRVKTWAVFKFMDLPWQVFGKQNGYQRRRHPYESQEPCSNKIRPWTLLLDPYCLNTSNFHKTVNRKPRSRQRIRIASIAKKQERRKELRPEEEKIALFLLFCLGDVKRTEAIKGCLCPLWVCRERRKYL
jgi:hypothetical protein